MGYSFVGPVGGRPLPYVFFFSRRDAKTQQKEGVEWPCGRTRKARKPSYDGREIAELGRFGAQEGGRKLHHVGGEGAVHFVHASYVQKWLDLIRGAHLPTSIDDLRLGAKEPVLPYADARLLGVLSHTLWFLPNVASCRAMANLLRARQNAFFADYRIVVCAGAEAGIGLEALGPVREAMDNPLVSKTITLSCGKLTTGVTIRPWTGIFMLRNLSSPETYFQAAFRVQSPWTAQDENGRTVILKRECYVFDFALDRSLRQIADYATRLSVDEPNPERKVGEFIRFLPVLAYEGSVMRQIDAAEILDIAMSGTSATLLAKRWQSALLVNVDNETLGRLLGNEEAMKALMKIEGFRTIHDDIETIISKSEQVREARREGRELSAKEKRELSAADPGAIDAFCNAHSHFHVLDGPSGGVARRPHPACGVRALYADDRTVDTGLQPSAVAECLQCVRHERRDLQVQAL